MTINSSLGNRITAESIALRYTYQFSKGDSERDNNIKVHECVQHEKEHIIAAYIPVCIGVYVYIRMCIQFTATHCNVLQHAVTHCNPARSGTRHCLSYTCVYTATCTCTFVFVTYCNMFQHTATYCNILQRTAIQHEEEHVIAPHILVYTCICADTYVHVHVATHCNTLQHTAMHCNTLQSSTRRKKSLPRAYL